MTAFQHFVSSIKEQMHATMSRSDVLRPLAWMVGLLLTATVSAPALSAPSWLVVLLATLLVGGVLLYGFAFTYCLFGDRDALRSEKYSLQKMAIQHGLVGDDVIGLIEEDKASAEKEAPAKSTKQVGRAE